MTVRRRAVLDALGAVRDPELDEPITELGFVRSIRTGTGGVTVTLQLPTYFCAPNFAYMMVADAHDAVAALPGVARADVRLVDHFAADEINAGVAARAGFAGTFPALAGGELAELRETFRRKSYLAALDRLAAALRGRGHDLAELARMTLAEVPDLPERASLLRRRAALGLPTGPGQPLLLDEHGSPIPPDQVARRLRFARTVRISMAGNAEFCRGLLRTRYLEGTPMPEEIRPAGPADRAAVEGVVQDAYRPWVERVGGRPQPMDADYAALIAAGQVHVTGADAIDGLIVLVPEPGVLLVENVAVRPELHGKGIGRRLLAFAEELAGRLGLPELRLYTHEKMESNIALYERLGYAETAREAIHVGHIVHMRKPTPP